MTGKYPSPMYRAGVKAVIKDAENQVLCVHDKDADDMWSLPGGGLDHGDETAAVALTRELEEEIDYHGNILLDYKGECIYYSHAIGAFVLYLIFDVTLADEYTPRAGIDAKEVAYLSEDDIADYADRQAEIIKKYGFGQDIEIPLIKA